MSPTSLAQQRYSLQHDQLLELWATTDNLLIIQDLDGVCMELVKDPLHRVIELDYVNATRAFDGHFYVLTNGEHGGLRGINGIIERAGGGTEAVQSKGLYLPGLAAGGVQWQDRSGQLEHPGVSDAELAFLQAVPDKIRAFLRQFLRDQDLALEADAQERCIAAAALDNIASPTANLNTFYEALQDQPEAFCTLQQGMVQLMDNLLAAARAQGLADSFFIHYAPNHGRDASGSEIVWYSENGQSGTTDFQFMLRGAIKEAGVLALLNRYYARHYGEYPLGESFSARQAPQDHAQLLALVQEHFDPARMPLMVGVGDTVTSRVDGEDAATAKRGGSDRNFLQLVQDIGTQLGCPNLVVYVDSSGGELKNRKALKLEQQNGTAEVVEGPGDPRDTADPLTLNVVFPGGYREYTALFVQAAGLRRQHR